MGQVGIASAKAAAARFRYRQVSRPMTRREWWVRVRVWVQVDGRRYECEAELPSCSTCSLPCSEPTTQRVASTATRLVLCRLRCLGTTHPPQTTTPILPFSQPTPPKVTVARSGLAPPDRLCQRDLGMRCDSGTRPVAPTGAGLAIQRGSDKESGGVGGAMVDNRFAKVPYSRYPIPASSYVKLTWAKIAGALKASRLTVDGDGRMSHRSGLYRRESIHT